MKIIHEYQARDMLRLRAQGYPYTTIAKRYGVCYQTARGICIGKIKRWQYLLPTVENSLAFLR